MKKNITQDIEALIDATSLLHVLNAIDSICEEKAEHIDYNWQDTRSASVWRNAANKVHSLASNIESLNI